ncbi:hypothetical protein ACYZTR_11250 [Pseudomonas sp. Hz4]
MSGCFDWPASCAWSLLRPGKHAFVIGLEEQNEVNQHLDLQINANNFFDRKYYSSISNSVSYGGDTYGSPAT